MHLALEHSWSIFLILCKFFLSGKKFHLQAKPILLSNDCLNIRHQQNLWVKSVIAVKHRTEWFKIFLQWSNISFTRQHLIFFGPLNKNIENVKLIVLYWIVLETIYKSEQIMVAHLTWIKFLKLKQNSLIKKNEITNNSYEYPKSKHYNFLTKIWLPKNYFIRQKL